MVVYPTAKNRCQHIHIGNSPMRDISFLIHGTWRTVGLKLEGCCPAGSSKDRTALGLISSLENRGLLQPTSIIVESTSGNLGISLAYLCRELGYQFLAVIDPKATSEVVQRLHRFGAGLEVVNQLDENGGYLLSRLRRVRELCSQSSDYVWTDQYSNPANPAAHYQSTAPEIMSQTQGRVDRIFVAVSTGGTLAGIHRYFRQFSPSTDIVAVDAVGSVVFGGSPGPRKLTGIGSSQPSTFIVPDDRLVCMKVADQDAFAVCRQLDQEVKLRLGGSSGAVLAACAQTLAERPDLKHVVCVCADGGDNYNSTIYCDEWLKLNGFDPYYRISAIEAVRRVAIVESISS